MEDEIIGVCGLILKKGVGCGKPITKDRLSIFNEDIKERVKIKWDIEDKVIGICKKCKRDLIRDEINDDEIKLLLDI